VKFPKSIKFRLNFWFIIFLISVVLFFSGLSYFILDRNLFYRTYAPLYLMSTASVDSRNMTIDQSKIIEPLNNYEQTFTLLESYSVPKNQLPKIQSASTINTTVNTPIGPVIIDLARFVPQNMPDGEEIWLYGRFAPDSPENYDILAVIQSKSNMMDILDAYKQVLLIAIPVTLILAGCLGYFLVRKVLKPVEDITRVASQIEENDLSRRIEVKNDDELGKLSSVLNKSFERLDDAFDRQRQFTADASHELRTPLAIMQTEASVALKGSRTPEEYQRSLELISQDISRMSEMIHKLLVLCRINC
jgi:signal transduction histidine kinase